MKNSNPKKSIANLENQKVDSDKIQGGGARPDVVPLTKGNAPDVGIGGGTSTPMASGMNSDIESDGSILNRRGIRTVKNPS